MTCGYTWSTDDFPRGPLPHQCDEVADHDMPHRCATCQAFYPKPEEIDYEDELEKAQARIEKLEAENKQLRSAGGWNTLLEGKVKPLRDVIDAIKAKWFEIVENGKTNEQICNDFDAFLFPDQP